MSTLIESVRKAAGLTENFKKEANGVKYEIVYAGDPKKDDDVLVKVDGKVVRKFNSLSDDSAYTNAKDHITRLIDKATRTPRVSEGAMSEVDLVLQNCASGEMDIYTVMNHPTNKIEQGAAHYLQQMYDTAATDHRLHPDDDFEEIIDIVADQLAQEYGTMESKKPSKEVMEARKIAGLPINEAWDDDEEDPDVKIASKDKRQQEFERKNKKAIGKVDPDKDMAKLAKKEKKDDDGDNSEAKPAAKKDKPAAEPAKASGGSFSSVAGPMVKAGKSAAEIRAALEKAGVTVKHLHTRIHSLRKKLKEGFALIHPHMASFYLAENMAMNQYQWVSDKDDSTTLTPMVFETKEAAEKVMKYVYDYKNQQCVLTPVRTED